MTNSPTIGNETQQAAGEDARPGERQRHQPECFPARAAEIGGGFEQGVVHLLEGGVERQHHEGQIGIDDADEDRGIGREPGHGLLDDAERQQYVVQQAIALQDGDPGIDADQERGPEWQDHRGNQHRLQSSAALSPYHRPSADR